MCTYTEIRISVSEEDSVGTGKAHFFKQVGETEETEIKTRGLKSKICKNPEELKLLNCGVGEDSWESLGLQGDPTSPS